MAGEGLVELRLAIQRFRTAAEAWQLTSIDIAQLLGLPCVMELDQLVLAVNENSVERRMRLLTGLYEGLVSILGGEEASGWMRHPNAGLGGLRPIVAMADYPDYLPAIARAVAEERASL